MKVTHLPLVLLAALGATLAAPVAARDFDAFSFFAGHSEGVGRLKKLFSAPERVLVHGRGRVEGDTLVLDQDVEEGAKSASHRTWRIRHAGADRYTGTLSDATGAVSGESVGDTLRLAFTMKGGLKVRQWLTLATDGQSARNVMQVSKFGVQVARLDETIRRTG